MFPKQLLWYISSHKLCRHTFDNIEYLITQMLGRFIGPSLILIFRSPLPPSHNMVPIDVLQNIQLIVKKSFKFLPMSIRCLFPTRAPQQPSAKT